ncbi:Gustatory and odorant receptor 63a [Frankliniella fusca]|uniref:Gustatory and odorant receptor 63a n=1 Tax=Frankliniella fusca TaxID=407009 RepID=A0AAE1HVA9_9NEOP|nr:Gustatory and odorant receptor 63a [Frankliniella fusca]
MQGVAEAFNYARRFQDSFLRVTGGRLSFGVAHKARVAAALCPVTGAAFVLWSHDAGYVPWSQFPVYEMNATYLTIVPETWVLIALALETAARRLRAELVRVTGVASGWWLDRQVLDGGGEEAARELAALRGLWLQLQYLLRMWSRALAPSLAHLLLCSVTVLLLSVFGISIPLLRHQVKDAFVKELTKAKIAADNTPLHTELVRFLKAVDIQDPNCSIGGFTSLDRALAVGLLELGVHNPQGGLPLLQVHQSPCLHLRAAQGAC